MVKGAENKPPLGLNRSEKVTLFPYHPQQAPPVVIQSLKSMIDSNVISHSRKPKETLGSLLLKDDATTQSQTDKKRSLLN